MIYSYFGLAEQEIILVEDTNEVFEPSATSTTWDTPKTVTLDPFRKIDKIVKSRFKDWIPALTGITSMVSI